MNRLIAFLCLILVSVSAIADQNNAEHGITKSKNTGHQIKKSQSSDNSRSFSVDVNINGLLLQEFMDRYEQSKTGEGSAGEYFGECEPFIKMRVDYPVVGLNGLVVSRDEGLKLSVSGHIMYRHPPFNTGGTLPPSFFENGGVYVAKYLKCRILASYYISAAGEALLDSPALHSQREIRSKIRSVFQLQDRDDALWQRVRKMSSAVIASTRCTQFLSDFQGSSTPNIECGSVSYAGSEWTISGRPTLSPSAINGESFKITVNSSSSSGTSADDTTGEDAQETNAIRSSGSFNNSR